MLLNLQNSCLPFLCFEVFCHFLNQHCQWRVDVIEVCYGVPKYCQSLWLHWRNGRVSILYMYIYIISLGAWITGSAWSWATHSCWAPGFVLLHVNVLHLLQWLFLPLVVAGHNKKQRLKMTFTHNVLESIKWATIRSFSNSAPGYMGIHLFKKFCSDLVFSKPICHINSSTLCLDTPKGLTNGSAAAPTWKWTLSYTEVSKSIIAFFFCLLPSVGSVGSTLTPCWFCYQVDWRDIS